MAIESQAPVQSQNPPKEQQEQPAQSDAASHPIKMEQETDPQQKQRGSDPQGAGKDVGANPVTSQEQALPEQSLCGTKSGVQTSQVNLLDDPKVLNLSPERQKQFEESLHRLNQFNVKEEVFLQ